MALNLTCNVNDPQQDGALISFDASGSPVEQDFVRGDINLSVSIRPVVASQTGDRPWDDDFVTGDTFQLSIGSPDQPPTLGTFDLAALGGTVTSSSVANPSVIVHAVSAVTLATGNTIYISGHTGSVPDINGAHVISVTDSTHFTIPVNVTTGGTGGNFYLASTGLTGIPFDVSPSALATALTVAPFTAPTVAPLATGVYNAQWTPGVGAPTFVSPVNALIPASYVSIIDDSTATDQVRIFDLKQQPVAFSTPATPFPTAGITATVVQSGSSTQNKIYKITMDAAGTYGGSYSLSFVGGGVSPKKTAGIFTPASTANAIQTGLEDMANSLNPDGFSTGDFLVSKDTSGAITIELTGAQALSNGSTLSVLNIDLLAPLGVTGTVALNTTNLYRAFWNTTAQTLSFTMEVRRTRTSREVSAIFQHAVTLKRNLIDGIIVPTTLPVYDTPTARDAAISAAIAGLPSVGTIAVQDADNVAITGGTGDGLTLTNTTVNGVGLLSFVGLVLNAGTSNFSLGVGSNFTVDTGKSVFYANSLNFTGTDGITINLGTTSGTLGSAAFTASTAYAAGGAVVSSGLTQSTARLLGRTTASTGAIEQITVGSGLTFTTGNLSVTNPYDPAAVAVTGGTIAGVAISATTLATSSLASLLGGLKLTYSQKTAGYSIVATDYAIELTANTATFTLPTAVGRIGQPFLAANSGSGVLTLSTAGGQTINGASTIAIPQNSSFQVTSNGANWIISGEYGAAVTGTFTTLTASGAVTFTSGTASSSTTTGAVVVTGGVGISGALNVGAGMSAQGGSVTASIGLSALAGDVSAAGGNLVAATVGKGVTIKAGTNGRIGTATLVGGTVTVGCTNITTSTRVQLTRITAGGTLGAGGYGYTISAGTSFTINSLDTAGVLSILDTSTLNYVLVEQN